MKKRGIAYETLVKVMMWAVVLLGLSILAVQFVRFTLDEGSIERCRFSVLTNSKVHESTETTHVAIVSKVDVPIDCPAHEIEIESKNKAEQVRLIGEELRSCWYKMGEGNLKVFGTNYITETDESFCVICSQFKTGDNLEPSIIDKYLNDPEKKIPGKDVTYSQYIGLLNNAASSIFYDFDEHERKFTNQDIAVAMNEEYLVTFYRAPDNYLTKFFAEKVYNTVLNDVQGLMVIPKAELAESGMCKKLFWKRE